MDDYFLSGLHNKAIAKTVLHRNCINIHIVPFRTECRRRLLHNDTDESLRKVYHNSPRLMTDAKKRFMKMIPPDYPEIYLV